jgi:iron complex transport system substrate-binding protein
VAGEHSRPRTVAEVRAASPELLVVAPCGYALDRARVEAERLRLLPEWAWARSLRIVAMDGNAFTARPGPRLVDGIEIMARLFNPTYFSPLAPDRGAAVPAA